MNTWMEREVASYPKALDDVRAGKLDAAWSETGKEVRTVFLVYLSVCAFGGLTLLTTRPAALVNPSGRFVMPLVGVSVATDHFLVGFPILLLALQIYLQIYVGHFLRFWRRARLAGVDMDRSYPWIATIATGSRPSAWLAKAVYSLLAWWAAPLINSCLALRASAFLQAPRMAGASSADLATIVPSCAIVVGVVLATSWIEIRRAIDVRVGVALPTPAWRRVLGYIVTLAALLVASKQLWPRRLARPAEYGGMTCEGTFDMTSVSLSVRRDDHSGKVLGPKFLAPVLCASFEGAAMEAASINHSCMFEVDFGGASLSGAEFHDSLLRSVSFKQADLNHASLTDLAAHGPVPVDFDGADLTAATISGSSFPFSSFDGTRMVMLDGGYAVFDNGVFRHVDLLGAKLWYSRFVGASIHDSNLEGADLTGADLSGATLDNVHLEGASLRQARLCGTQILGGSLRGADLRGARLRCDKDQPLRQALTYELSDAWWARGSPLPVPPVCERIYQAPTLEQLNRPRYKPTYPYEEDRLNLYNVEYDGLVIDKGSDSLLKTDAALDPKRLCATASDETVSTSCQSIRREALGKLDLSERAADLRAPERAHLKQSLMGRP